MSDSVQLTIDKDIAIISINNPPVNALSPGVPEGISEALDRSAQDNHVKAIVLIGGGRTFVAGADIKEFAKITSRQPRGAGLLPLLLKIEDSIKAVTVAIHGTAFGGGLELAMAGHYRVALKRVAIEAARERGLQLVVRSLDDAGPGTVVSTHTNQQRAFAIEDQLAQDDFAQN